MSNRNEIEIKSGRKKVAKFKSIELLNESYLLNLYKTETSKLNLLGKNGYKNLFTIEFEKGLTASYKIETRDFNINDLKFKIFYLTDDEHSNKWLAGLVYQDKLLEIKKTDSVTTRFRVYEF